MKVTIRLRKGEAADASAVGDICYRAFKVLAESHHFTPDFSSADLASSMLAGLCWQQLSRRAQSNQRRGTHYG
jgi:hypothetical protein